MTTMVDVTAAPSPGDRHTLERQVKVLAEAIQSFAVSLNLQETLRHAIASFVEYLDAEAASIFLLENNNNELVCQQCAGPVDITGLRMDANQGIVGKTVRELSCQMVRDVQGEESFYASIDAGTGFATRSILCAPLVVRGQCIGALELVNKKSNDGRFDEDDMHLVTALGSAVALAVHNARMAAVLVEQERVRKELELVREVQVNLLPKATPEVAPVVAVNIPAREVSGDFYDYFALPDGRIYFNLGDVSGKGMNTALWMAKTTGLLRCLAKSAPDLSTLLARVNDEVYATSSHGMFVTLVTGMLDLKRDEVLVANAGHLPALYRGTDGAYRELFAEGPPLGVMPEAEFRCTRLALAGGSLYLVTDGVTESADAENHALGVTGLRRLIDRVAHLTPRARLEQLVAALRLSGQRQRDDITLMLLERPRL
ncbi:MAG: SpoIIE family protein phosphatase [Chromatiales bacterium]